MFITIIFSFLVLCIFVSVIIYFKNAYIPKEFISVKSEIKYFEERIKWRDTIGSPKNPQVSKTYYVPIVEYTYDNNIYIYKSKNVIMLDNPDFNRKMVLYINPKKPYDGRHRFKNK
jgi:hypothetical protein